MKTVVIDASVAVKWFLHEPYASVARSLLEGYRLIAPDLLFAEVGNVLWQRVKKHDITTINANRMLANLAQAPIRFIEMQTLASPAIIIACETNTTMYDSLYLAAGLTQKVSLITADKKLISGLEGTSFAKSLIWLPDL